MAQQLDPTKFGGSLGQKYGTTKGDSENGYVDPSRFYLGTEASDPMQENFNSFKAMSSGAAEQYQLAPDLMKYVKDQSKVEYSPERGYYTSSDNMNFPKDSGLWSLDGFIPLLAIGGAAALGGLVAGGLGGAAGAGEAAAGGATTSAYTGGLTGIGEGTALGVSAGTASGVGGAASQSALAELVASGMTPEAAGTLLGTGATGTGIAGALTFGDVIKMAPSLIGGVSSLASLISGKTSDAQKAADPYADQRSQWNAPLAASMASSTSQPWVGDLQKTLSANQGTDALSGLRAFQQQQGTPMAPNSLSSIASLTKKLGT